MRRTIAKSGDGELFKEFRHGTFVAAVAFSRAVRSWRTWGTWRIVICKLVGTYKNRGITLDKK